MGTTKRDKAFQLFYAIEAERLLRFSRLLTGGRDEAWDLAQDALLRTYVAWPRIRNQDAGPYARKILVNLYRNSVRRAVIERAFRLSRAPSDQTSEEMFTQVDVHLDIARALATLPLARRVALILRYYEDMSDYQIAEVLGRPLGTVKSDIRRGLAHLARLLHKDQEAAR